MSGSEHVQGFARGDLHPVEFAVVGAVMSFCIGVMLGVLGVPVVRVLALLAYAVFQGACMFAGHRASESIRRRMGRRHARRHATAEYVK